MSNEKNVDSMRQRALLSNGSPSDDKLQGANRPRDVDDSLHRTAHNLRAPLSSVLGLIDLVKHEDAKNGNRYDRYFNLMKISIKKLDNAIKEMLEVSRDDLDELRIERIDLRELVLDCLEKVRFMPGTSGIDMHVEIAGNFDFYSDRSCVVSILDNLIANAIKYSDQDREVSYLHIHINIRRHSAELKFRDNGIGIQKKYLEKVFDKFFRVPGTTDGTGLGLSIVKETVEKLNGSIDIESRVGYGTTISLCLHNHFERSSDATV